MNKIPLYSDWKDSREYDRSFDVYRQQFPSVKEYQVFSLDPNTKMSHIEDAPILETDRLDEAHAYIYKMFNDEGLELCIFQQRTNSYRGHYRHSNKHSKRNASGQFAKA